MIINIVKRLNLSSLLPGRSLLFLLLVLLISQKIQAKTYYFSRSGLDSYSSIQAQNMGTPWQTIGKLNSIFSSLLPGDSILFKRGEVFYGAIVVTASGALNKHIVLSAYGTGADPLISGFTAVNGWNMVSPGIYRAAVNGPNTPINIVTQNNVPLQIGRYPNANAAKGGYMGYQTFRDTSSITDSSLSGTTNWAGAEVVIRKKLWVLDRCQVQQQRDSVVTFINPTGSLYDGTNNYGYWFQNDLRTLDQEGEWHYNPATRQLTIVTAAVPPANSVKIATQETLLTINTFKFITINGIAFEGGNQYGIYAVTSDFLSILNCRFTNMGGTAIQMVSVSDILLENTSTYNVLNNAVRMTCSSDSNIVVRNCVFTKSGFLRGMGQSGANSYKGLAIDCKSNLLIEYNNIDSTGYIGLEFSGSNVMVRNNVVNHFCFNKDDGGGIYTYVPNTEPPIIYTNRTIKNNIVMNGVGAPEGRSNNNPFVSGIYLDGRIVNVDVQENTVFNVAKNGIHCNNPVNVNVTGNTVFNTLNAVSFIRWSWGFISNFVIKHNILYPKLSTQRNLYYINGGLNEPEPTTFQSAVQSLGIIDSNYHSSSNQTGFAFECYLTAGGTPLPLSPRSLESWQLFSLNDLNSRKPFREAASYAIRSLAGSNLFSNGYFNTGIGGLIFFGANFNATWDNNNIISGGSLKLQFTAPSANRYLLIHAPVGVIDRAKKYVLRFRTSGATPYGIVRAFLRKTSSPFNNLVPTQVKTFGIGIQSHEFLFNAPISDAGGSFVIEVEQNSGTTYIDNIELYEADASVYELDEVLRLEYNSTRFPKTVSLGANFIGVDATYYPGTITLAPFTSKILVKDTAVLRQPLTVRATGTNINCFGGFSQVTVSATGGIPPYIGTGTFSVAAGSYTYTVADLRGVVATANIVLVQPAAPLRASATVGNILVYGSATTVQITASGGTPPYVGTGTFNAVTAGAHAYTIKDARGCTSVANIVIGQPQPLRAVVAATAVRCFGGTSTVIVTASGGIPPYSGIGSFDVVAGSYNYLVQDAAGAVKAIAVTVTQPAAPLVVSVTAPPIPLQGNTTTVTLTANGGTAPYTGIGSFANITAGSYQYQVTDARGCQAVESLNLIQQSVPLAVSVTAPVISCFGGSTLAKVLATGGTAPYTGTGDYSITAGKGSVRVKAATPAPGVYNVMYFTVGAVSVTKRYMLQLSTMGTAATGNLRVSLRQSGTPFSSITPKQSVMYGSSRVDHSFVFTAPATTSAASFLVEIEQNSGITFLDNLAFFEVNDALQLIGENKYPAGNFEGGIASLFYGSNNNNHQVSWDTNSRISNTYHFTVTDANYLTAVATLKTSQPNSPLIVKAIASAISPTNGTASVVVSATGGSAPYTGTGTFNNLRLGTYTYTVTDAMGCSSSTTITIAQSPNKPATQIRSTFTGDEFSGKQLTIVAYPNPTSDKFALKISGGTKDLLSISVSTPDGKSIISLTGKPDQLFVFGTNLPSGLFLLKVMQGTTVQTIKLVKF